MNASHVFRLGSLTLLAVSPFALEASVRQQGDQPITNTQALLSKLPVWRLKAESLEYEPTSLNGEFHRVFVGVIRPDGGVVIVNVDPPQLLVFDARGHQLRTIGRKGRGPGEFERPDGIQLLRGDSVAAFEMLRATVFDSSGKVGLTRSLPPDAPVGLLRPIYRFVDGSLMATAASRSQLLQLREGVQRATTGLYVVDTTFRGATRLVAEYVGPQVVRAKTDSGWANAIHPLGFTSIILVSETSVYLCDTKAPELRRIDLASNRQQRLVFEIAPRWIPTKVIERVRSRWRNSELPPNRRRPTNDLFLRQLTFGAHYPFFDRALLSRYGHLFLRRFVAEGDANSEWLVVEPNGTAIARLITPTSLRVLSIEGDNVLGVVPDRDDIEHVVMYRIKRL